MRPITVKTVPFSPDLPEKRGILLNEYARTYLHHPALAQIAVPQQLSLVLCTPSELGLTEGCTLQQLAEQAGKFGFSLCHPLSAVYLRLHLSDQPESGNTILTGTHRAPDGSITVLSQPICPEDGFPRGLYLRNVDRRLWLRGYVCDTDFIWSPTDVFALSRSQT